jgi:hypothetical protein
VNTPAQRLEPGTPPPRPLPGLDVVLSELFLFIAVSALEAVRRR